MQGALSFHHWLSEVILATVYHYSRNTWLDKLASDVGDAIDNKKITTLTQQIIFQTLPSTMSTHSSLHSFDLIKGNLSSPWCLQS